MRQLLLETHAHARDNYRCEANRREADRLLGRHNPLNRCLYKRDGRIRRHRQGHKGQPLVGGTSMIRSKITRREFVSKMAAGAVTAGFSLSTFGAADRTAVLCDTDPGMRFACSVFSCPPAPRKQCTGRLIICGYCEQSPPQLQAQEQRRRWGRRCGLYNSVQVAL